MTRTRPEEEMLADLEDDDERYFREQQESARRMTDAAGTTCWTLLWRVGL